MSTTEQNNTSFQPDTPMTGIDPLLLPVGVWAWENYGKDAVSWIDSYSIITSG